MNHLIVSKLLEEKSKFILYNENNIEQDNKNNDIIENEINDDIIENEINDNKIDPELNDLDTEDSIPQYWI